MRGGLGGHHINGPDKMLGKKVVISTLRVFRVRGKVAGVHALGPCYEKSLGGEKLNPGQPEAPALPASAPRTGCHSPGVPPEDVGARSTWHTHSSRWHPSVQWKLLPAPSKTVPDDWGHALPGDLEVLILWHLTLGIPVSEIP
jgi:hypothetical protein